MTIRQERLQSSMLQELSEMIRRDVRDPRVGFVTLTGAEITRDLRFAKVFVSVLGDEEARKASLKVLNASAPHMRGEFGRRAHLRVAPEITFIFDTGPEHGAHIFALLKSVEADLAPRPVEDEAGVPEI